MWVDAVVICKAQSRLGYILRHGDIGTQRTMTMKCFATICCVANISLLHTVRTDLLLSEAGRRATPTGTQLRLHPVHYFLEYTGISQRAALPLTREPLLQQPI